MNTIETNEPMPVEQYIVVPASWFERLVEISKMSRNDDKLGKQFLLGYISSAETIVHYST